MDFLFRILDQDNALVVELYVSADDIREARQADDLLTRWSDREVAVGIYEQRYESALAKIRHYNAAQTRLFHLDIQESK